MITTFITRMNRQRKLLIVWEFESDIIITLLFHYYFFITLLLHYYFIITLLFHAVCDSS